MQLVDKGENATADDSSSDVATVVKILFILGCIYLEQARAFAMVMVFISLALAVASLLFDGDVSPQQHHGTCHKQTPDLIMR